MAKEHNASKGYLIHKLYLANRVQAILYALREGMVDLDEIT